MRDERAERQLIGQLLMHPDRWRDAGHFTLDHFTGARRRLFKILRDGAGEGRVDLIALLPELRRAGVSMLAIGCLGEWLEAPASIAELTVPLEDWRRRRDLLTAGRIMTSASATGRLDGVPRDFVLAVVVEALATP